MISRNLVEDVYIRGYKKRRSIGAETPHDEHVSGQICERGCWRGDEDEKTWTISIWSIAWILAHAVGRCQRSLADLVCGYSNQNYA